MVTRLVVDASVVSQWYLTEQNTEASLRLLERDLEFIAPDMLVAEVASVIWKICRYGTISETQAVSILREFMAVNIRLVSAYELAGPALDLAIHHGRSVYDCLYLALALSEGCQFVTADRKFYDATVPAYPETLLWVEDLPPA